ncbi:MAG: hypothetical protein ACYC35_20865 [Pirellulales bacterium]
MSAAEGWKDCFQRWPEDMPRHGVLVTAFGEQIPFDGFLLSDTLLLLERHTPDTIGARKVLLSFEQILALKIVDIVKPKSLQGLGFRGSLPTK